MEVSSYLFESFLFFRQQEIPEHRDLRLEKQRESDQTRIANETPKQRQTRLKKDRLGHQSRYI